MTDPKRLSRALGNILAHLKKSEQISLLCGQPINAIKLLDDGFEIFLQGETQKIYFQVLG